MKILYFIKTSIHGISHLHTFPKFYFCDLAFLAILLKSYFPNFDKTFNSQEQQPLNSRINMVYFLFFHFRFPCKTPERNVPCFLGLVLPLNHLDEWSLQ